MNSPFLTMLKQQNPDKEYPSNTGQKWTDEEESVLLDELDKKLDIDTIAEMHKRTAGGIISRCREIAYKLYTKNIDMQEIMLKTRLDRTQIIDAINRRKNQPVKKEKMEKVENVSSNNQSSEIAELKKEIISLKNDVKEMLRLIHQLYDFETQ